MFDFSEVGWRLQQKKKLGDSLVQCMRRRPRMNRIKTSSHLNQRLAERSPHKRVDDWVDTGVEIGQNLGCSINQQCVLYVAVREYDVIQLVRQPCDGERRRDSYAHPGDFAGCLLLSRRARTAGALSSHLNSKTNCSYMQLP